MTPVEDVSFGAAIPPRPAGPPPGRRSRRPALIVAIAAVLAICLGVGIPVATRGDSRRSTTAAPDARSASPSAAAPTGTGSPGAAVATYYGLLAQRQSSRAFALLCPSTQASLGLESYVHVYDEDLRTGTGVTGWRATGTADIRGAAAAVPGSLTLAGGSVVAITVLTEQSADGWHVCTSDLGGVLPSPGGSSGGGTVTT